jgi:hypothetical protein
MPLLGTGVVGPFSNDAWLVVKANSDVFDCAERPLAVYQCLAVRLFGRSGKDCLLAVREDEGRNQPIEVFPLSRGG